MNRTWSRCAALVSLLCAVVATSSGAYAAPARATATVRTGGEVATIVRDAFGRDVPLSTGKVRKALFGVEG